MLSQNIILCLNLHINAICDKYQLLPIRWVKITKLTQFNQIKDSYDCFFVRDQYEQRT
jgi:hypothetical protein